MTAYLSQADFKTFERKVAILAKAGVDLDYTVAQRNKRKVKITLNKEYVFNALDAITEGAAQ